MKVRSFSLLAVAAVAAAVLGQTNCSAALAADDQSHTVLVVNNTDVCVRVRVSRDEAGTPTMPPTRQRVLAPKTRFSVSLAELAKDLYVEADIMGSTDCTSTKVVANVATWVRGGVVVAGKRPDYIIITAPLRDVQRRYAETTRLDQDHHL